LPVTLSIQGCMAVGKTTAVNYLKKHASYVHVSYENNSAVIQTIKTRHLNKNIFDDYVEIQKLWIQNEIVRWEEAQTHRCSVMDFGAEEIEFYTWNYPKSIGVDWNIGLALHKELEQLKHCMPNRILFLEASEDTLQKRKEKDTSRSRTFFEYYIKNMMPLKEAWCTAHWNADRLNVESAFQKGNRL